MATNQQTAKPIVQAVHEAIALAQNGDRTKANAILREIEASRPQSAGAWRAIGDGWHAIGEAEAGGAAHLRAIAASVREPELIAAADALAREQLDKAEPLLKARLRAHPTDVATIRMLAELAGRIGRNRDAETLLLRALELAPGFAAARQNLATALHRQGRSAEAIVEIDKLLADAPDHPGYLNLKAAALGRLAEYEQTVTLYRQVLRSHPRQPKVWMSLAHSLKTLGQQPESIDAYRRAIELQPSLGEVWWSLANLKTFEFTDDDVAAMQGALGAPGLDEDDKLHLHFALGKAAEDRQRWKESFDHYAEGNRLRRALAHYDPAEITRAVDRVCRVFTPEFLAERECWGCPAPDPIFVVSLPRSGSTLVEQILASHSQVEGTMELPDIAAIATRIGRDGIAGLSAIEVRALGEEYLDRTRIQRKAGKPHFIDKMPNNWLYVGFIRLILPNATIIDARRHPLACCFSNFKQHFARGQTFTYDLAEIGLYYRDYVRAMAHIDRVMPGHVHRLFYERMVDDTEAEVRALIAAAGLPFEESCLRFHQTERAIRTASSEQVRRPIFREGLDQWRHYEAWMEPLKAALGPVLELYPDVPPP